MSLLVALWEVVPGPSTPCLSHQEDSKDRRSRRFLPWSTGMTTRKARVTVPRKKIICCTRSPARWRCGGTDIRLWGTQPTLALPGTQGLRDATTWLQIPSLPLPSCANRSKLLYLSELLVLPLSNGVVAPPSEGLLERVWGNSLKTTKCSANIIFPQLPLSPWGQECILN